MLRALELERCSELFRQYLLLYQAFLIQQRADDRRMSRAFDKLTQRHEGLRKRFAKRGGEWRAVIDAAHMTGLRVDDIGDVDDKTFDALIDSTARAPMDPVEGPLCYQCRRVGGAIWGIPGYRRRDPMTADRGVP